MSNANGDLAAETSIELLLQDSLYIGGVIQTMGFAIQFLVYGIVMRILWSRRKIHPFTNWALMIHSTAMCLSSALSTLGIVVAVSQTFIHHKNFPGGTTAYIGVSATAWFNVMVMAGLVAGNVLGDFVLLWRCSVIWRVGSPSYGFPIFIMIVPTVLALATLGSGIALNVFHTVPNSFLTPQFNDTILVYFTLSIFLNIVLTSMIVFKMKRYQKEIVDCFGLELATPYISIRNMFIESSAVYTLVSLPELIAIALQTPLSQIFVGLAPPVQMCCSYLIIWRVAEGRAFSNEVTPKYPPPPHSAIEFRKSSIVILTHSASGTEDTEAQDSIMAGNNDNGVTPSHNSVQKLSKPTADWDV